MPEPVSLAEIKRHLVLDPADTSEDEDLSVLIVAARRSCELKTRRSIVTEERYVTLPGFPAGGCQQGLLSKSAAAPLAGASDILLPGGFAEAITVRYWAPDGTDTLLDPAAYYAAIEQVPVILRAKQGWPASDARPDAVRIEYTVAALPPDEQLLAKQAIKLIVGHWYANREAVSPDGRAGAAELPLSVTWILQSLIAYAVD